MARAESIFVSSQVYYGGSTIDPKIGIPNSFWLSEALDFRKQPSQMSVLPGLRDISNGVITDLIQGIVQVPDGNRIALGNAGNVYKINTSNIVSKLGNIGENGAAGICYRADTDTVYLAGLTTVSTYGPILNNPVLTPQKYAQSISTAPLVAQTFTLDANGTPTATGTLRSSGGQSYTVPTAISEDPMDTCPFIPDIEPAYSIFLLVVNKGTGDWTITLHDENNTVVASKTLTNANIKDGALNEFAFGSQIRLDVATQLTYHFHVTSTVAGAVAGVVTAGDFSTANFAYYAYRLVSPNNGLHPMSYFQKFLVIGNERYISIFDGVADVDTSSVDVTGSNVGATSGWDRHRLVMPPGLELCGLSINDEYLVIAHERRSQNAAKQYQNGYLFFWDGAAAVYNFSIDVPMGSPQSLYTYQNITYFLCNGALYAWVGSIQIVKVRTLDYTDTEFSDINDSIYNYPNMMTIRRGILVFGFPSYTTSTAINYGIHSWGSIDKNFPQSYGYSYILSNGLKNYSISNNLKIGCVANFNDSMYVGWGANGSYGLDLADNTSNPASNFIWRSLIWDGGLAYKQKRALRMVVRTLPLPSGVTITPVVSLDRGNDVLGPVGSTVGQTDFLFEIESGRAKEIQYGFNGTCSGSLPPTIIDVAIEINPLPEEVGITS